MGRGTGLAVSALVAACAICVPACRKRDRLPSAPFPQAKLAYRVGNCVYMDLNHAGEPEKGICYGDRGEPMMAADFDGNGTTDLAVRRGGVILIDNAGDGQGHESAIDLGDITGAGTFLAADFSGTAGRRAPASVCVFREDRCRIQGAGAAGPDLPVGRSQEPFVGRWRAEGPARFGTRLGRCVDLDETGDGRPDKHLCYEDLGSIDQVLAGDWNGDGRDDLILRRGGCVFVDLRLDGSHSESQCLGEGRGATDYFVGSWDGK